jgi:hypothetical protein
VQFRPLIDLIQKFRLSDSTIDQHYSFNSVDMTTKGGTAGFHLPYPAGFHGSRQIFSPLLLIHQVNLCGFQRIRMSSHPAVMVVTESKVPGLITRIAIVTRVLPRIDLIGGAIATKGAQPMIGR